MKNNARLRLDLAFCGMGNQSFALEKKRKLSNSTQKDSFSMNFSLYFRKKGSLCHYLLIANYFLNPQLTLEVLHYLRYVS